MAWTILFLALFAADAPKAKPADKKAEADPKVEAPAAKRVVDRSYRPAVGDRAVLYYEDEKGEILSFFAATSPEAFRELIKAEAMDHEGRIKELEASGKVLTIEEDETPVVITAVEPIQAILEANELGARVTSEMAVAARVLDGPHKGKVLVTASDNVARFKTVTAGKGTRKGKGKGSDRPKAMPKMAPKAPANAADRAATLLRLGEGLEKAGKPAGALDYYRKIVKEFPDTPQAKTAAARIEMLGGK